MLAASHALPTGSGSSNAANDSPDFHHQSQHHPNDLSSYASTSPSNDGTPHDQQSGSGTSALRSQTQKPKQKRNKPTLSCRECVDRKTKCDRGRPTCEACIKRGSPCHYSEIANVLATQPEKPSKIRKTVKTASAFGDDDDSSKLSIANITNRYSPDQIAHPHTEHVPQPIQLNASSLPFNLQPEYLSQPSLPLPFKPSNTSRTPVALSSLSMPNNAPLSIFGIGREHPFANYWTATGGLAEVVDVLPTKEQADILVTKYFEIVDPMYPIIDREDFLNTYEHFWRLPPADKCNVDAAVLALHFVVYATATQYIELAFPSDRPKTAEFYISAAHQALRISSYWNHITIPTVQAMAMTFYFLINDNHVSDAYTHTGMTVRQAYVLQIHRDPDVVDPTLPDAEKRLRLKLWQAVMHQDVGLTQFLKLPPTATHTDIAGDCFDRYQVQDTKMSDPSPFGADESLDSRDLDVRESNDLAFSKSLYVFTQLILDTICSKRALGQPICDSVEGKRDLVDRFRHTYAALPRPFGSMEEKRYRVPNERLARQQISLSNNWFHSMMLIYVEESSANGVHMDVWGALEAAHEAIGSFFIFWERFGQQTDGFWVYQHRAFEIAITMANLLAVDRRPNPPGGRGNNLSQGHIILRTAKEDVARMLHIISNSKGYFVFQSAPERRYDVLKAIFDRITIV